MLSTDGTLFIKNGFIAISYNGIIESIKIVMRFLVVIFSSLIFIATTKTFEIKAGIEWLCSFLPYVSKKKISTMIGLLIRFIPMMILCNKEVEIAQSARGSRNIRNPVSRIKRLVIPVIFKTFYSADNIGYAMKARAYSEDRTGIELNATGYDWLGFLFSLSICGILIFFD